MSRLFFSLVLYKQTFDDIYPLLMSIENLNNLYPDRVFLSIYDNTSTTIRFNKKKFSFLNFPVKYIHDQRNIGFGKANNRNFKNFLPSNNDLFIISNPDTYFDANELKKFIDFFLDQKNIVCANPLIRNKDSSIQHSSKRNPTFLSLLLGFLPFLLRIKILREYDLFHKNKDKDYVNQTFQANFLSGSFLVVKSNIFKKVGGFTDSYFLHLEDADLVRKCSLHGETAHLPKGEIIHTWNRGSHKSLFQISHIIRSMVIYFYIWGFKFI